MYDNPLQKVSQVPRYSDLEHRRQLVQAGRPGSATPPPRIRPPLPARGRIKHSSAFAPNPFWGRCALGACPPNHMGIKLDEGDWILANSGKSRGHRIVCVMHVAETLDFDDDYRAPRFEKKKPAPSEGWKRTCGDNIYFRDSDGNWKQGARTRFYTTPEAMEEGLRHPRALVPEELYQYGENALPMPEPFRALLRQRHGCSCRHDPEMVAGFIARLRDTQKPGINALPADRRFAKLRRRRANCESEGEGQGCG